MVKQEPQAGLNQASQSNLDDDAKPELSKLDDPQVAFPKLELSEDQMSDLRIAPRKKIKSEEAEVAAWEDFFNDIMITKVEAVSVPLDKKISNEIESYRSAKDLGLKDDPLQWWKSNAIFYPILSRMAKRTLCVPASSVPSEQFFFNSRTYSQQTESQPCT